MALSDSVYASGFLVVSGIYWLAFLLSVTVRNQPTLWREEGCDSHGGDHSKRYVSLVYLLGAVFYSMATLVYGTDLDETFGMKNICALGTQVAALSWNFALIVLALSWTADARPYAMPKARLKFLYLAALTGSAVCFAAQYPGPLSENKNYIISVANTLPGSFYLLIYTSAVFFTKIILLALCIPLLRNTKEFFARISLSVAMTGSCFLLLFACLRSTNPFSSSVGIAPYDLEPVTFLVQLLGAVLIAVGFSLPRLAFLRDRVTEWRSYYRVQRILAPMASASRKLSPTFSQVPTSAHSPFSRSGLAGLKMSVHRDFIAILDAGSLTRNKFGRFMEEHNPVALHKSLGSLHLDRFSSVVAMARKYNELVRGGLSWRKAYDAAIMTSQHSHCE